MDLLSFIARNVIVMDGGVTSPSDVTMAPQNSSVPWNVTSHSNPHSNGRPTPEDKDNLISHKRNASITSRPKNNVTNIKRCYSTVDSRRHAPDASLSRRHSVADFSNQHDSTYCCLPGSTSFSDIAQISWSEYTARKSRVKFRNRRAASYRKSDHHDGIPPSALAVRLLCTQYEVCRQRDTQTAERVMAVFYCWFFGWITDVYNGLTHGGAERSFFRWMVSCVLVALGASVFVGLSCLMAHGLLVALTHLLHSGITFIALLVIVFLLVLTMVTILSYSSYHGNQDQPSIVRRVRKAIKQKRM